MHPAQLTIPAQCGVVYCVLWQQLNDNSEAPIHPSHPLPFTPTSPQLGRQSLSHLVGYRKKQHVCAYWCACIISEVLRVACGPYNMLVSSGGCLHEWKGLLLFGGGGGGGDEGQQGPSQLSATEWNALLPDTPCRPCRVNGTVMRGSSADTWVSVNMLTAITVPNGLTSSLSLAFSVFLLFSLSYALSPSPSHLPSCSGIVWLWKRLTDAEWGTPVLKGKGAGHREREKEARKGMSSLPLSLSTRPRPHEGHVFVCFWMRDVWDVSYVRNEQHRHKYERHNTDRHTPLALCPAQK